MCSILLHRSIWSRDLMVWMLHFALGSSVKSGVEHGQPEHLVEAECIIEPTWCHQERLHEFELGVYLYVSC